MRIAASEKSDTNENCVSLCQSNQIPSSATQKSRQRDTNHTDHHFNKDTRLRCSPHQQQRTHTSPSSSTLPSCYSVSPLWLLLCGRQSNRAKCRCVVWCCAVRSFVPTRRRFPFGRPKRSRDEKKPDMQYSVCACVFLSLSLSLSLSHTHTDIGTFTISPHTF